MTILRCWPPKNSQEFAVSPVIRSEHGVLDEKSTIGKRWTVRHEIAMPTAIGIACWRAHCTHYEKGHVPSPLPNAVALKFTILNAANFEVIFSLLSFALSALRIQNMCILCRPLNLMCMCARRAWIVYVHGIGKHFFFYLFPNNGSILWLFIFCGQRRLKSEDIGCELQSLHCLWRSTPVWKNRIRFSSWFIRRITLGAKIIIFYGFSW